MSTATPLLDPPVASVKPHTMTMGSTTFTCIEPRCDLLHHVWCSCAH